PAESVVAAAAHGPFAVGGQRDAKHLAGVPDELTDLLRLFDVPHADRPVAARGDGPFPVAADRDRVHLVLASVPRTLLVDLLASFGVPQAKGAVPTSG